MKKMPNKASTLKDGIYVQDLILVKKSKEKARAKAKVKKK